MRRIRRWVAFGFVCGGVGLAGWDASAASASGGGGGFGTRGSLGASGVGSRGFRSLGYAVGDRRKSRGFGSGANGYGARQGSRWRAGRFGDAVSYGGGYWPGYGIDDGHGPSAQPIVIVAPPRFNAYPTVLDLPVVPGIRAAPSAEPVTYTIDRDELRRPQRTGAKILSRGRDGHFAIVEGSGEAGGGASDPRIIHIRAPQGR